MDPSIVDPGASKISVKQVQQLWRDSKIRVIEEWTLAGS